jgi:hypothetical protein
MTSFAEFVTQLDEAEIDIFVPALETNDILLGWSQSVNMLEDMGDIPENAVFQLQTLAHYEVIPYSYLTKLGIPF